MPSKHLRVVFDCNIFWRAFFYRQGLGNECKRQIDIGNIRHFVSAQTVEELIDVLTRDETLAKFPECGLDDANEFVKDIVSRSTFVRSIPAFINLPRDVDDEAYLNLAITAEADYLVTTDLDLLDLMRSKDFESKQFRQRFRGLKIVRPDDFLRIMLETGLSLQP